MGYELIFHYKESTDKPGMYSEEVKNKTYKVGKVTEDINLDVVAGKIMSQLARRNILIVDVEIYEYAKKKLNYRETVDGIVIKNKKFSFDSGAIATTEDFAEDQDFKPLPSPSKDLADQSCPLANSNKNLANIARKRAIRHEIYEPEPLAEFKAKQKGLKFTSGKKYPIYSESSIGSMVVYKTTDDTGKEVDVSSEYFIAVGAGISEQDDAPNYVGAEQQKDEINLWGRYEQVDMPDIRGGK